MAESARQLVGPEKTGESSAPHVPRYSPLELEAAIRQGEILSDIVEWLADPTTDPPDVLKVEHEYCVVATQDCDLEQDFNARNGEKVKPQNHIAEVLLLSAFPSTKTNENHIEDKGLHKKIRNNDHPKLQLLESVPSNEDLCGEGVPELVVDMKQVFSIRRDELYRQISAESDPARRRARLVSPYRDHLQTKLAFHLGRVGLPEPHLSA